MRQIERLNQALRIWEDMCYVARYGSQAQQALGGIPRVPLGGPIRHFEELRQHLLQARSKPFDADRFLGASSGFVQYQKYLSLHFVLPLALFCWNHDSRRVFRLEEDLQILLDATSLDRIRWKDVVMPFDSFAVSLERPFEGEVPGITFDCVLVSSSKQGVGKVTDFRLLSTNLDDYQPISRRMKKMIERASHQQRWQEALTHVDTAYDHLKEQRRKCNTSAFSITESQGEALVTDSITELIRKSGLDKSHPLDDLDIFEWDVAARIVVGMCLYLQTLPANSPHKSDWKRLPRSNRPDPTAITEGANVCTISSSYKLNREEREVLGLDEGEERTQRSTHELRAHFRMGHWRRAPGTGSDPTAPKVVHVRPTIVRRDRLREDELPGGSEAIL